MHQIETYIGCIHTELDIIMLIDLCQQDILARVTRRLTDPERKLIKNGSVFVYEEVESKIKRWTDGRIWSPSRCSGIFLTYTEYMPRVVNRMLFMKKTLTAKLRSKVYHIVAYVNLEDEMSGVCCFKYGNRLKIVYEEYIGTQRRCMIESIYNKKRFIAESGRRENNLEMYEQKENAVDNRDCEVETFRNEESQAMTSQAELNQVMYDSGTFNQEGPYDVQGYTNEYQGGYGNEWLNQNYVDDEYFYLENPYNNENMEFNLLNRDNNHNCK